MVNVFSTLSKTIIGGFLLSSSLQVDGQNFRSRNLANEDLDQISEIEVQQVQDLLEQEELLTNEKELTPTTEKVDAYDWYNYRSKFVQVDEPKAPPKNAFLSSGPYPMTHNSPYSQSSSYNIGPTDPSRIKVDSSVFFPYYTMASITLAYSNDGRSIWGSSFTNVFKIDRTGDELRMIDTAWKNPKDWVDLFHGAYSLIDDRDIYYSTTSDNINAYTNKVEGDSLSGIKRAFQPFHTDKEFTGIFRGLSMTWDGKIVYITEKGYVGIVSRDLKTQHAFMELPGDRVNGPGVQISNSIAVDEDGGIYVVTNKFMQKLHWDGTTLNVGWVTPYEDGGDVLIPGRLGLGSGTTPSIMGDKENGRFVVIGDGAPKMNIVFFDCETGAIVASHPIDFGKDEQYSMTEQSILVNGWRALVTSNDYQPDNPIPAPTGDAPKGLHQFEFDPVSKVVRTAWTNSEISIPNGITTMSAQTGLIYGIGKRDNPNAAFESRKNAEAGSGLWTLECLDWWTGESKWHIPTSGQLRFNSVYAATEVGGPGEILSGTGMGVVRYYDHEMLDVQRRKNNFISLDTEDRKRFGLSA